MRQKALSTEEREIQVINWFAIRIQHDNKDYATLYEIAKGIGLSPSTHLRLIVSGMVIKGLLHVKDLPKTGRWFRRGYMLKSGSFQRPHKQQVKINFTVNGVKQMELI